MTPLVSWPESRAGGGRVAGRRRAHVCGLAAVAALLGRRPPGRQAAARRRGGGLGLEERQEEDVLSSSPSSSSPEQRRLLQRALQVAVHLDVAAAQVHAQLVEALDQPGPVGAAQRLHAQRRDGGAPVVPLLPAAGRAHLGGGHGAERVTLQDGENLKVPYLFPLKDTGQGLHRWGVESDSRKWCYLCYSIFVQTIVRQFMSEMNIFSMFSGGIYYK